MKQNAINIDRIHGFDAMRAIMMMLGIVLHSAMTYSDVDYGAVWPLKDAYTTSHGFHILLEYIHFFRMPAFFVIAGFFGALLFYKKSPQVMISNRLHRIVYPFFVALLILWPLTVFAFNYSILVMAGSENILQTIFNTVFPAGLIPQKTIHLWFLYYLALISFAVWFVALKTQHLDYSSSKLKKVFESLHRNLFIVLIPASFLTFLTLFYMGSSYAITSAEFIPDPKTFLFYTVFYTYGWILFLSRELITKFAEKAWLMLMLGSIMFVIKIYFDKSGLSYGLYFAMYANAIACWLYIFAAMGLFLLYASSGSSTLRYISDSAYWVYLIHLPIIGFLAGIFAGLPVPAIVKFLIILLTTTTICFVTYHYFVRNTFIGQFLNGRKYPGTSPSKAE